MICQPTTPAVTGFLTPAKRCERSLNAGRRQVARGEAYPEVRMGRSAEERKSLAPLLQRRAELLSRWTEDDELWDGLRDDE